MVFEGGGYSEISVDLRVCGQSSFVLIVVTICVCACFCSMFVVVLSQQMNQCLVFLVSISLVSFYVLIWSCKALLQQIGWRFKVKTNISILSLYQYFYIHEMGSFTSEL